MCGLCVPAVGRGGTGQDDGSTAGRVEVAAPAASGWMKGTGTGRESCQWRGYPNPHCPAISTQTLQLQAGGFSPAEHPRAPIAGASVPQCQPPC